MTTKIHKGKAHAWVNITQIDGVVYTMWRGIVDPTDLIVSELTLSDQKEKIVELKGKKAKGEWKKIKDKAPAPPAPTPPDKPKVKP